MWESPYRTLGPELLYLGGINMDTKEYEKAMAEVIDSIKELMQKSPEHGNAVMDILGEARYRAVQNLAGRKYTPYSIWEQEIEFQCYRDRVETNIKLRELMEELENL